MPFFTFQHAVALLDEPAGRLEFWRQMFYFFAAHRTEGGRIESNRDMHVEACDEKAATWKDVRDSAAECFGSVHGGPRIHFGGCGPHTRAAAANGSRLA